MAYLRNSSIGDSYLVGVVGGSSFVGGLVGQIDYGTVSNSHTGGSIIRGQFVGGLVGMPYHEAVISNSYSTSNVIVGGGTVGGLVGSFQGISINNSYATGNVSGFSTAGGLVGSFGVGSIVNSYAKGNVNCSMIEAGGLVGSAYSSSIVGSYATGNVVSGSDKAGGLVGTSYYLTVSNSYSTGNVVGGEREVGGFIGYLDMGSVVNSYSTGTVAGGSGYEWSIGGFVGDDLGGSVSDSYWDVNTSEYGNSGDNNRGAIGKTTEEMKNISAFEGWDITSVVREENKYANHDYSWNIVDGGSYPFLSWQYTDSRPKVHLFSVENSTATTRDFTFAVSDDDSEIAKCSLYVDGVLKADNGGIDKSGNNTISLSVSAGVYNSYVSCEDQYGFVGNSNEVQFEVYESDAPEVYLFPVESSTSTSRDFIFNVSDESDILKCSLYLDGVWKADNISEINKTDSNVINWTNLSIGSHDSLISCEDQYGNVGNSSEVSFEVQEEYYGGGGGGVGPVSIFISEQSLQNGYTRNLRKKDSLWFNHNGEKHLITINDMDENLVDITVQSEPQKFNIKVGESVNVDLNDDGVYDVEITYVEYLRTLASIKARAISEEYKDSKVESDINVDSEAIVRDDGWRGTIDERKVEEETKSNNWIWWIVAVVLVFVAVSFVLNRKGFFTEKKKRR